MLSSISSNLFAAAIQPAGQQGGGYTVSTRVTRAESASTTGTGIIDLGVQVSDHLQRISDNQSVAIAQTNDGISRLTAGSRRMVAAENLGADRQYSAAGELNGFDVGSNVDTMGGPFEVIDRVLQALDDLGDNPLLAQTRLLPSTTPV